MCIFWISLYNHIVEVITLIFPDYDKTKCIYHIISIIDLKKTLEDGITFDDKMTYKCKYLDFHNYIDKYKNDRIPDWVIRRKAIFGSMNFKDTHYFHAHTAVLKIKPQIEKCWIANENLANNTYEPFILKELEYPVAPMVLGIILGNMVDVNFRRTIMISNGNINYILNRPIGLVLLMLFVLWIFSFLMNFKKKTKI